MANYGLGLSSPVADGGVAHKLDTTTAYASGTLLSVRTNGTQKFAVAFDGAITGTIAATSLAGTTLAANVVTSSLTTIGTLVAGAVPASLVTAGTFGAGNYDFPAVVTVVGPLVIGHTTNVAVGTTGVSAVMATNSGAQHNISRWQANATGPILGLGKSRSGTIGSYSAVQANDTLGTIRWYGDDGVALGQTAASASAAIKAVATATFTSLRVPGKLVFSTAPGTSDSDLTDRMALTETGVLILGSDLTPKAGSHLEITVTTGSSAITPAIARLRSRTSAADWLMGSSNYWAAWQFWSNDSTGLGEGVRAQVTSHFENAGGSLTGLALWVSDGSSLGAAMVLNSDRTVFLSDTTSVPTSNPTGGGLLYSQSGTLKWRGSSGTVTTIASA